MSETKYSFKNLELWKAAQAFAIEVVKIVDALPNRRSVDVVGRQLIASATSIAANIAEGHGRYTFGAYRNHLSIAKGSAAESQSWLDFLIQLELLPEPRGREIERQCDALMAALTRRIVALEQQEQRERKTNRVREERAAYNTDAIQVQRFLGSKVRDKSFVEEAE